MRTFSLDDDQYRTALEIARQRHFEAVRLKKRDAHGLVSTTRSSIHKHLVGCCGEIAVRLLLDEPWWQLPINTFKREPDIPPCIDVRTRTDPRYELIVRPNDPDNRVTYLVIWFPGTRDCSVIGHMWNDEAKRPEWLASWGDRPPAYFVPTASLDLE